MSRRRRKAPAPRADLRQDQESFGDLHSDDHQTERHLQGATALGKLDETGANGRQQRDTAQRPVQADRGVEERERRSPVGRPPQTPAALRTSWSPHLHLVESAAVQCRSG